jgi:hypothetical protein
MNFVFARLRSRLIPLCLICFVLVGCASAADGITKPKTSPEAPRLGREFKLRPGQQISLQGTKLRIQFTAVANDSRCPSDVTCVWAGNAAVRLNVSTNRRDGKSLTLNTAKVSSLANEAEYRGYKVKLVDLTPYPRSNQKIAAGDYVLTLLVSKN